ncbi:MAG: CapA family protein [Desulfobacteraceae bacterium]|nr:CapA family protein [Desulfobacteraceae bacterium]
MAETNIPKPDGGEKNRFITLFMCGDVMTGRGVDQILPHPSDPRLYETYVKDAGIYVELAEWKNGPVRKPVSWSYIWGDALSELRLGNPDLKIINLETAVTTSNDFCMYKGINYRMHPKNIPVLTAAGIDLAVLANNHVIDWGKQGLIETLDTLESAKIRRAGAGRNLQEAESAAVMEIAGKGRVLVFSFGLSSSGIPYEWAASDDTPGVAFAPDLSGKTVRRLRDRISAIRRKGDIVIASVHWGGNWGYRVSSNEQRFARAVIDEAGVDIVHGHSSHHPRGIEVYRDKPIIYGCGDFINDYEGIRGHEEYRGDLTLMYFITMDPQTGKLVKLHLTPMQIKNLRLNRVSPADAGWLKEVLDREGKKLGTRVTLEKDLTLGLHW